MIKLNKRIITMGLSLLGVAGVGATSLVSIKCHEKAKTKATKKEKIIAYAPAIGVGVATSACILGSHYIDAKEIAALTATCGYLASNKQKIEGFIKEKFGSEKLLEAKEKSAMESVKTYDTTPGVCYERTGKGNQRFLFYEQGRYFCSNFKDVLEAGKKFNNDISNGLIPTWNDYYDYIGIQKTRVGEEFVVPENYFPNEWNTETPLVFDYIDWTDEHGVDVTLIFIDTTLTPYDKEF